MIVEIIAIGQTTDANIERGVDVYLSRLKHYGTYKIKVVSEGKNNKNITSEQIKTEQGKAILSQIQKTDFLILLDEKGEERSSENFAKWWQSTTNRGGKKIVFVIGGAYGFSDAVYERCDDKISLSKMTFSHQMVRLFFVEQLYRAHTIIKGEPYHHS